MDNRLRFLYHVSSELWGHRRKADREGNTGASEEESGWQIRRTIRRRDADRTKVGKCLIPAVKKSRYCVIPCARTVNRHRWMRRES